MSQNRRRPDAGFTVPSVLPRGLHGRALCRYCRREVPEGRKTFCGPDCVHEWKVRTNPGYVRKCLLARDDGVCARCGLDAIADFHRLKALARTDPAAYQAERQARKIPPSFKSLWFAHHAQPVSEGGGECGLAGFLTWCHDCHRVPHGQRKGKRSDA